MSRLFLRLIAADDELNDLLVHNLGHIDRLHIFFVVSLVQPSLLSMPLLLPFPLLLKIEYLPLLLHVRDMQFLIHPLQLQNILIEQIAINFGLMLFAHYVRVVVGIGLSADRAERVFFVGPREHDFRLLLEQQLLDVSCVFGKLKTAVYF